MKDFIFWSIIVTVVLSGIMYHNKVSQIQRVLETGKYILKCNVEGKEWKVGKNNASISGMGFLHSNGKEVCHISSCSLEMITR